MQASQSNTAAGLPQLSGSSGIPSGPHSDPAFTRKTPSPLSAPIQAARKYLERQRGGAWQIDTAAHQNQQGNREQGGREQASRERDRRLERSLYQGHSIEAGLNYEEAQQDESRNESQDNPQDNPQDNSQMLLGAERAYLAESDGSEALFPYTATGSMPSPEAVRGAIFRLARESQIGRDGLNRDQWIGAAGDSGAEAYAPPLAFEDVARRLWGANSSIQVAHTADAKTDLKTDSKTDSKTIEAVAPIEPETYGIRSFGGRVEPPAVQVADPGRSGVQASQEPEARNMGGHGTTPAASVCRVEEEPALAHDACNLLSALGLYSDLLSVPGVLPDRHLHYADELKLVARRSQLLIDRLLQVAAARKAEVASLAAQPTVLEESGDLAAKAGGPQSTSLVDLLMRWGSLLSTLAHGTLEVVFGPQASTPVPAAPEALERILVNLVRNARAATVAGGAVRISVGVSEDGVSAETPATLSSQRYGPGPGQIMVLTVDDSGCGMTSAEIERLLSGEAEQEAEVLPVYRAIPEAASDGYGRWPGNGRYVRETATEIEARGAVEASARSHDRRQGLGFKIVRELVTASGGALSIQSWPGRGTRIEVRWPVTASAAPGLPNAAPSLHQVERTGAEATPTIHLKSSSGTANVTAIRSAASTVPQQAAPQHEAFGADAVAVGPDGFSEAELRAMMLRLHRAGPNQRTIPDRSPADRCPYDAGAIGAHTFGAEINDPRLDDSNVKGAIAC